MTDNNSPYCFIHKKQPHFRCQTKNCIYSKWVAWYPHGTPDIPTCHKCYNPYSEELKDEL